MSPYPAIEQADFGNSSNRIAVASQSLDTWCKRRQYELAERDCSLRLAIAREGDAGKRAELAKELQQAEQELRDFGEGVKNSSLRRAVSGGRESALSIGQLAEQRFMPGSAPAASNGALKTQPPGTRAKLNGLAACYNSRTEIGHYFAEIIMPGAFREVIKNCDCRFLLNHKPDRIFGRTTSESLRLYESPTAGLVFWCDLLDDDAPTEALVKRVQYKILTGCSFSFICSEDRWILAKKPGELDLRVIVKIGQLYDVGVVTYPAYPQTSVEVVFERSAEQKTADDTARYMEQAEEEEFQEITSRCRSRRREVEKQYLHAGRIIGRCRNELTKACPAV
jgi:hypothetical protein